MGNLDVYEAVRSVPKEAQKIIEAGNIKGFTDINPMWRIKTLTEQFGMCGIGWWYTIDNQWLEPATNGEVKAFCNISLYVAQEINGTRVVSQPIIGTGGSTFIMNTKSGAKVSDECYKMALTDAISVAAKALGIGADIYWDKDKTKYSGSGDEKSTAKTKNSNKEVNLEDERVAKGVEKIANTIEELKEKGVDKADIAECIKKHYSVNGKPSANYKKITDVDLLLTIYKELSSLGSKE